MTDTPAIDKVAGALCDTVRETYDNTGACTCKKCVAMCYNRPCWPLPDEALRIIHAGHGHKLMLDYRTGDDYSDGQVDVLAGAVPGYARDRAPWLPHGKCSLLQDDRCTIHDMKPVGGSRATCDEDHENSRVYMDLVEDIGHAWDTEFGRAVIDYWCDTYYQPQTMRARRILEDRVLLDGIQSAGDMPIPPFLQYLLKENDNDEETETDSRQDHQS